MRGGGIADTGERLYSSVVRARDGICISDDLGGEMRLLLWSHGFRSSWRWNTNEYRHKWDTLTVWNLRKWRATVIDL